VPDLWKGIRHLHQIFVNAGASEDDLEELSEQLAELLAGEAVATIQQAMVPRES
jgi:hypothetical protein